jgi:hypothetical protein
LALPSALLAFAAVVLVGIAEYPDGGEWLARLAPSVHDLIVLPSQQVAAGAVCTHRAHRPAGSCPPAPAGRRGRIGCLRNQ